MSDFNLVPTLCVGTHVLTLCVASANETQSVGVGIPTQSVGTRSVDLYGCLAFVEDGTQ